MRRKNLVYVKNNIYEYIGTIAKLYHEKFRYDFDNSAGAILWYLVSFKHCLIITVIQKSFFYFLVIAKMY